MIGTIARGSARTVVAAVFAATVGSGCCDPLDVDIVGTVTDESINSAAAANAAAQVAGIPTNYVYQITFAVGTGDNGIWAANTSIRASTVGDSVDPAGTIQNALPFGSANDPRVCVIGSSTGTSSQGVGADGGTNLVIQQMWGRSDPVNLASGLDARLFGRGQRFGDLRHLVRQYGRPQNQVFPTGTFFKGGTYGTDVNFDVSSAELTNPQFTACIDRNA